MSSRPDHRGDTRKVQIDDHTVAIALPETGEVITANADGEAARITAGDPQTKLTVGTTPDRSLVVLNPTTAEVAILNGPDLDLVAEVPIRFDTANAELSDPTYYQDGSDTSTVWVTIPTVGAVAIEVDSCKITTAIEHPGIVGPILGTPQGWIAYDPDNNQALSLNPTEGIIDQSPIATTTDVGTLRPTAAGPAWVSNIGDVVLVTINQDQQITVHAQTGASAPKAKVTTTASETTFTTSSTLEAATTSLPPTSTAATPSSTIAVLDPNTTQIGNDNGSEMEAFRQAVATVCASKAAWIDQIVEVQASSLERYPDEGAEWQGPALSVLPHESFGGQEPLHIPAKAFSDGPSSFPDYYVLRVEREGFIDQAFGLQANLRIAALVMKTAEELEDLDPPRALESQFEALVAAAREWSYFFWGGSTCGRTFGATMGSSMRDELRLGPYSNYDDRSFNSRFTELGLPPCF